MATDVDKTKRLALPAGGCSHSPNGCKGIVTADFDGFIPWYLPGPGGRHGNGPVRL
jgi:hypothetical protein